MEATGKTIGEVATELGVSRMQIVDWRTGLGLPEKTLLRSITRVCKTVLGKLRQAWEISKKALDRLKIRQEKNVVKRFPRELPFFVASPLSSGRRIPHRRPSN